MAEMEAKRRPLDKVKNMTGWSVGAVCELDFEILREGDRIHGGEGKYRSLCEPLSEFLTWMNSISFHAVIQGENLGFIFKSSHSFTPPPNPGAH